MKTWIRSGLVVTAVSALLVPLLLSGAQDAPANSQAPAQTTPAAATPAPSTPAATAPAEEKDDEEGLAPGEKLSADNNISWPVDI